MLLRNIHIPSRVRMFRYKDVLEMAQNKKLSKRMRNQEKLDIIGAQAMAENT